MTHDVEILVMRVFNEFSSSAKRVQELKSCFDFVDLKYKDLLRHVATRWLSLLSAIERLISTWPAVSTL